jgi:predicted nucleotidyltransferase
MIGEQTIEEVKNRLVKTYDPLAIYIFGSYAWGHPDDESDLDLLIVIDKFKKDRFKTMSEGYTALRGMPIFKDILVYSKDEFDTSASDSATLCNRIKREGKKIYARA